MDPAGLFLVRSFSGRTWHEFFRQLGTDVMQQRQDENYSSGRERQKIDTLQAGRALAAAAVVFHHAGGNAAELGGNFVGKEILARGYLGVDFFFVLSGFIIFHTTIGRGRSFRDYVIARVRRVYLPYLPVGIAIALLYTVMPQLTGAARPWSWLPTLTLLPVEADTALNVAWTLKYEILFYAVFGLSYFGGFMVLGLALWAALILFVPSLAIPFAPINLEFLFGILAAVAYRKGIASPLLLLPAAACAWLWVALGAERPSSILVGLAIALVLPVLISAEMRGRLRIPGWLTKLGDASYSLYLVHLIPIAIVSRLVTGWPAILTLGIVSSFVAGLTYHYVVELRLLRWFTFESSRRMVERQAPTSP